ncbi:putative bifunctional phosphatase/peptidyl-prolyl cis-trans isomerase [termite gut metagenome]|uniref:peptidylprolyl isomerase n=1 Tax=termite gut metagenome TaxID=433724 RepID=A0A5J4SQW1_9ZZZZ
MKTYLFPILIIVLICGMVSCQSGQKKETMLKIETSVGDITVKLYDETPKHRDNFVQLAQKGAYDGTLFHRVIKDFMIQGGDPQSVNAPKDKQLGGGDVGYRIPGEFVYPQYFHKRGSLAAARTGDNINPKKESSGCQFYIVTGRVYSEAELLDMEQQQNLSNAFNALKQKHAKNIQRMQHEGNQKGLQHLQGQMIEEAKKTAAENSGFRFTPEQILAYTTVGGTPFLDNEYTVYGEITEGMNVVDKIQQMKTGVADRPEEDVIIKKVVLL